MPDETLPFTLQLGPTEIVSHQVRIRPDTVLDQVRLSTAEAHCAVAASPEQTTRLTIDELFLHIVLSEPNLNAALAANMKSDLIRNVKIALFSGKLRVSGHFVKLISIPFTLDAIPRVENGVRIVPDFLGLNSAAFALPASVVELLEQRLRPALTLDLTRLPLPVYLNEVICEPGRLLINGKARIQWPAPAPMPVSPFATPLLQAQTPSETQPPDNSVLPPPHINVPSETPPPSPEASADAQK